MSSTDYEDTGLFGAVKSGKNIKGAIDDWIEEYDRHPDGALVKLHQFFLSCCGCKGVITLQMLSQLEYSEIIRRMTEDFDEDSVDDELVIAGTHWKKFRGNMHTMLFFLIDKCKSSIVFDQRMMDGVIQLLTGLADSQVRAFRHTATFAALKISSFLVDVSMEIVYEKEKNSKRIDAEEKHLQSFQPARKHSAKLTKLQMENGELASYLDQVPSFLKNLFATIFMSKYRDILPDIRAICITELGNWLMVYPEHFLEDTYLKYIGWSLHDKIPDVRLKCINALDPLFQKTDVLGKLELFVNKFKDRIVSMVMDKDNDVAVNACRLLASIHRVFPSLLKPSDCVPIYELVYTTHRGIAVAAGEFLNTNVFQYAGRHPGDNADLLKDLVQFFIEGECHDHASYLVDALIDTNPIIKDWPTQVALLLGDEVETSEGQLIEILACSIRQAATGDYPVGRSVVKRGEPTTKENQVVAEDRTRLSKVLIPSLPELIQKFIADQDKIINLVSIALYFQLDLYMAGRLENYLNDLMRVLQMIVEKHTDETLMSLVAEVVSHFSTCNTVAQHTETSRLKLIDGLALQLRYTITRCIFHTNPVDEDKVALQAAFKKITSFARHLDFNHLDLWDPVFNVLTNHSDVINRDVVEKSILFLFMQLNWDLHRIVQDIEGNKEDAIKKLKKRRDAFMHVLYGILSERASGVEMSFRCLKDILFMFSKSMTENGAFLEPLIVPVTLENVFAMMSYVTDNLFSHKGCLDEIGPDQQIEKLIKFYSDFGDILKQLLPTCTDLDYIKWAKLVSKSLINAYKLVKTNTGLQFVDPLSDLFQNLRDLAKRFGVAFGSDHLKNREAIAWIHKEGIIYSLQGYDPKKTAKKNKPENLTYLEVIMEFSGKMLKQDKQALMRYLERHSGLITPSSKDDFWGPYHLYKNSLMDRHTDDASSSVRSFSTISSAISHLLSLVDNNIFVYILVLVSIISPVLALQPHPEPLGSTITGKIGITFFTYLMNMFVSGIVARAYTIRRDSVVVHGEKDRKRINGGALFSVCCSYGNQVGCILLFAAFHGTNEFEHWEMVINQLGKLSLLTPIVYLICLEIEKWGTADDSEDSEKTPSTSKITDNTVALLSSVLSVVVSMIGLSIPRIYFTFVENLFAVIALHYTLKPFLLVANQEYKQLAVFSL